MSKALESILGFMPLTETLRTTTSGIPDPFPPEFAEVSSANKVMGDRAKYIRVSGEKRAAKRVQYGAPAKRRSLRDVGDQPVRMMHSFESFPIELTMLQKLRSFEKYQQDEGMDWLKYQLDEAAKRQANLRIVAKASMLRHGAIYFDSEGTILPTSSGADSNLTISAQVPATHQNQCNGIISASWALPNTDIPNQIDQLQNFSVQETGMELEACMYGINIPKYLRANNFVQAFLSRNPGMNDKMTMSSIPDGLFGVKRWIPVWKSFYETDDDGTKVQIWDDDLALFVPNVTQPDKMTWWATMEGSMPVPRTIDVQRDPMTAIRNAEMVYGVGGFSVATVSPPSIEVYYFDTFLPAIKNEKATFAADVAF